MIKNRAPGSGSGSVHRRAKGLTCCAAASTILDAALRAHETSEATVLNIAAFSSSPY